MHTDKKLSERIETIMGESKEAFKDAFHSTGVNIESIGQSVRDSVDRALSARDNVVMVRMNAESICRVDELIEAGIVSSRSEAVAFLVSEGIDARSDLFAKIREKVEEIRQAKQDLRDILSETRSKTQSGGDQQEESTETSEVKEDGRHGESK